jgi:hypothetical protein
MKYTQKTYRTFRKYLRAVLIKPSPATPKNRLAFGFFGDTDMTK